MDRLHDHFQSYSWHQSHDQATVLLLLPYETTDEDVAVTIDEKYLLAGVRGQPPVVKGQLYGRVDTSTSVWQLEPRPSRLSARDRTISTTSTASTHSSYALVSEPEISSSFAASLAAGLVSGSDLDDAVLSSPALSSPVSSSADERLGSAPDTHHHQRHRSRPSVSPPARISQGASHIGSFSSLESLHTGSGRLLTLHLEKADSIIWPSLVVGPVPESISPPPVGIYPWNVDNTIELQYNMDPTSLVLIALDLYDIRKAKEDAFEYFVRAWHQAQLPSAAIRLATHYLPLQTVVPDGSDDLAAPPSPTSSDLTTLPDPGRRRRRPQEAAPPPPPLSSIPGMPEYYLARLGGASGLAQLFLAAGLLHLEGTASSLLTSSYAGLSSLRTSTFAVSGPPPAHSSGSGAGTSADGADVWRRDRDRAAQFFVRARALHPALDVPLLPTEQDTDAEGDGSGSVSGVDVEESRRARSPHRRRTRVLPEARLSIPAIDVARGAGATAHDPLPPPLRNRRKRRGTYTRGGDGYEEEDADAELSSSMVESVHREPDIGADGEDSTWYLYLPGLVGAGTALLVVGLLSLQSWRKNQG
ncbi:uncharacterized protein BXZ73DRAFT_96236 [Epithele typhae]|uniref:uncharacterized protein n=1 Tax=Epithele typhae TaxID=378194 RepID=UPI002007605D|nr:uncharacterized protein BXZ73DRAFT_96236 [Epithele typhae]KAH9945247.1 hypothetical protein BXZ73DRAFT_96236 [Epithele typhae]